MKQTIYSFLFLATAVVIAACSGGSFKKTKTGLLYKIINNGSGKNLKQGDFFELQIGATTYTGGKKDTLLGEAKTANQIVPMDSVQIPPDYITIFSQAKKGDSIIVRQSTDSIIKASGGQVAPFIKKGGFIVTTFKVVNVFSNRQSADSAFAIIMKEARRQDSVKKIAQMQVDDKLIQDFLAKNKINAVKTALGCYVQVLNPGTGAKPDSGKQVSVMYNGLNFEGVKFDSNIDTTFGHVDALKFVIGQMGMIPGFEDGVKQIGKGGKIKVFVPSSLAYGAQGSPPKIKPNENLIFELELVDITTAPKPTMPSLPQQGGGNQ
ncbi:MAG: FKBP-type peptidyl-prolyl cis-trans isomerase [Chitinophagaceae bacterium]|nr:FKBP-type peptidyl-prolyl cis-trans isomerase [Chitinophagaceae bacterium]